MRASHWRVAEVLKACKSDKAECDLKAREEQKLAQQRGEEKRLAQQQNKMNIHIVNRSNNKKRKP